MLRNLVKLLVVVACLGALACTKPKPLRDVDVLDLQHALAKPDTLVLDVSEKTPGQETSPLVDGARQIPFSMLPYDLETVPKDRNIYVVGRDWGSVVRAANLLLDSGYRHVARVQIGGLPPPPK
jgi:rhodanese-related sulfurtransferase